MTQLNIKVIALAIGLAFSAGAMAEGMSKADYKAAKEKIEADHKAAKAACTSLSGNAKDICVVEAKGKEKVAAADLEASYTPGAKTAYKARVAKAEADYAVAKERCDDMAGNAKDVCVKEAKSALVKGRADAKVDRVAAETRDEGAARRADARDEASADKRDAEFNVALEKCDSLAGAAKESCVSSAKAGFGKS